jgi:DNA-binding NarL/FixJ family response regulator
VSYTQQEPIRGSRVPLRSTTVLIVEARAMVADTMARTIKHAAGFALVGRCASSGDLARACVGPAPDVGVMDLSIYGYDARLAVASLREHAMDAKALLLVPDLDPQMIADALLAGATNCISALVDCRALLRAIRATAEDRLIVPPDCQDILPRLLADQYREHERRLSVREIEVLRLVALGLPVGEIAVRMFISVNTVNKHLAHSYRKLGVASRSGALAAATRLGLV